MQLATETASVRVLLVDDHPLYRNALRNTLTISRGLSICGEAGSAAEARRLRNELDPHLVVLDLGLPDADGLALLRELRSGPNPPQVLIVTVREEDDPLALEALRLGASGFVCKRTTGERLLEIVESIRNGHSYMPVSLLQQLLRRRP